MEEVNIKLNMMNPQQQQRQGDQFIIDIQLAAATRWNKLQMYPLFISLTGGLQTLTNVYA